MDAADRSGDPNFPHGLRIHPSSSQRHSEPDSGPTKAAQDRHSGPETDGEASSSAQTASWEQDTVEDIQAFGIAGRIWEAAYLLARYLRPAQQVPGELEFDPPCSLFNTTSDEPLTIVELGSGAGYGSLHLARQLQQHATETGSKSSKATLVLTDLENVVPLMERNVARAGYKQATELLDVRVRSLAWGNDAHAESLISELQSLASNDVKAAEANPISHILCSDLVYFPELLPLLLRSIISLSSYGSAARSRYPSNSSGPELIISYKIRSLIKEQPFWFALDSWFDFQAVDCRSIPRTNGPTTAQDAEERTESDCHRFGSEGQDYGAPATSDQELFVFVGHRRRDTIGCLAPESDSELMQGKRLRPRQGPDGVTVMTIEASSGQDYFEWLLLSNMGAGLD
ncbi:Nicotinamide N-methyltransferase-like protein [Kalmanozyma brasiliensis GHG001]|uniref:Nicotinamide N-methyltransferase-like protein n=1 Tax=Kalmanozyma brasiliensis (strain GHG001) TaxID=1365824 RepID=UPI002867DDAD|nr:Nicotinamide N-methyltransferase-like protein [Kalmanozyma brasiliensis GHG001]KAF6767505.1 Nicotinamide N-methyltransferase-like protein [Kalmanozyma brasiliensis GHG001]